MRLSCSSSSRSKFSHWRVITGRMGKLPSHYEAGTRVWERKTLNLRKHLVAQLCVTLLQPHGLRPTRFLCPWDSPTARILEWVAIPFSRGSSPPRDRTQVSLTAGEFFTSWATRESGIKASSNWQKWGSSIGYTLQIVVLSGDRATKSIPIVQTQSSCQLTPEIAHIPENTVRV